MSRRIGKRLLRPPPSHLGINKGDFKKCEEAKHKEISEKVKKGALSGEYIFFGNSAWRSEAPEKSAIFQRSESLALSKKIS